MVCFRKMDEEIFFKKPGSENNEEKARPFDMQKSMGVTSSRDQYLCYTDKMKFLVA